MSGTARSPQSAWRRKSSTSGGGGGTVDPWRDDPVSSALAKNDALQAPRGDRRIYWYDRLTVAELRALATAFRGKGGAA
jgi:hypothetical protein